jgi:hypothetical protein
MTLTVGELRRALEGVADYLPVVMLSWVEGSIKVDEQGFELAEFIELSEVRNEFNRVVIK